MTAWHPTPAAHIGLRTLGGAMIASVVPQGRLLHMLVLRQPAVTPLQLLLAMIGFLCASLGVALVLMGPGLWKPVCLSPRWTTYGKEKTAQATPSYRAS